MMSTKPLGVRRQVGNAAEVMNKKSFIILVLILTFLFSIESLARGWSMAWNSLANTNSTTNTLTAKRFPRILLFITTHVSEEHFQFLERCWPFIVQNTKLVAMSDIFIFSAEANDRNASKAMLATVNELLVEADYNYTLEYKHNRTVTLVVSENPGYQEGANLALKEAALHDWFEGYDWVVRINPDVLIYNDTWILDIMKHDQNASVIFADCHDNPGAGAEHVHTDFMIFRPEVFPKETYGNMTINGSHAETTSSVFFSQVLPNRNESYRWLPDTGNHGGICRVGHQKLWGSPVIHSHEFINSCPQPDRREENNTKL